MITHMNGAGNSFFVIDALNGPTWPKAPETRSALARRLCRETQGLSADGLVFLDPEPGYDFRWDFYNDDGSSAEMCGNAARCMALFFGTRYKQKDVKFQTRAGEIRGKILADSQVRVWMPKLADHGSIRSLTVGAQSSEYFYINTGVPHIIVPTAPDRDIAKLLRHAPELGDAGSNVTFYEELSPGKIKAVTYERGVEDYTLACGTGATAAAVYARKLHKEMNSLEIQMPGGLLKVSWEAGAEDSPILTGPAEFDFEIQSIRGESL